MEIEYIDESYTDGRLYNAFHCGRVRNEVRITLDLNRSIDAYLFDVIKFYNDFAKNNYKFDNIENQKVAKHVNKENSLENFISEHKKSRVDKRKVKQGRKSKVKTEIERRNKENDIKLIAYRKIQKKEMVELFVCALIDYKKKIVGNSYCVYSRFKRLEIE